MKKQSYDVIIIGCGTAGILQGMSLTRLFRMLISLCWNRETIFIVGVVQL